jgi:hypothetical protein
MILIFKQEESVHLLHPRNREQEVKLAQNWMQTQNLKITMDAGPSPNEIGKSGLSCFGSFFSTLQPRYIPTLKLTKTQK